ncbi:intradiol ring-cleavage dioxygenase [Intrasporangium mesophilum]
MAPHERPASDWLDDDGIEIEDHDRGLRFDLQTLLDRRRALSLIGGLGLAGAIAACSTPTGVATSSGVGSSGSAGSAVGGASASASAAGGALVEAPDETGGPFPGDGSNGPNVLDDSGIIRSDIRRSYGGSTTTAEGVPLTVRLTVKDLASSTAMVGAAVYLWHCNRDGQYSLYSSGVEGENYLRGVQATDDTGTATFTSVYPACYDGRWPHIHFEVYASVADATTSGPIVKTSQIALPQSTCETVYATAGYEQSVQNLSRVSLATDMVFRDDGGIHQLATMSGDPATGYIAALTIAV